MKLAEALDIKRGDIVSFVGAGGKTSAMFRLAHELSERSWRVVTTTTTHVAQDELQLAPARLEVSHLMAIPQTLESEFAKSHHVFVYNRIAPSGKVEGVSIHWLNEHLAQLPSVDALLVEADGSRQLPIKGPLPHEPPIPSQTTIVIPVVGLNALDQPLDSSHVYGVDVVQALTGHPLGAAITESTLAALITHPQLGLKNVPHGARVMPLLNQASTQMLARARKIAKSALLSTTIERVLVGSVQEEDAIYEIRRRVGAVILAAGQSKRMGQPKLLLPWNGSTIIRHICQRIVSTGLFEVVLVAGEQIEDIRAQIADLPIRVIYNPDYARGEMLSSLKAGLNAIHEHWDASLVVLGDQPSVDPSLIDALLDSYARGLGRIVAPSYDNKRGHPLLIDKAYWQAIMDLQPDKAPRDVLRANEQAIYYIVVQNESVLEDIDTPEDYGQALQQKS